jgi:hypothetical protein
MRVLPSSRRTRIGGTVFARLGDGHRVDARIVVFNLDAAMIVSAGAVSRLKDAASVQGRFWRLARKRGFASPVRIHIDGNLPAKVSLCLSREASVLQEDWLPSG